MARQEVSLTIMVKEDINLCGPRPRQTTTLYIFDVRFSKAQPANITFSFNGVFFQYIIFLLGKMINFSKKGPLKSLFMKIIIHLKQYLIL